MNHVISWSGGKDSTATVILFHKHENELLIPGDTVTILFAEVMFDKEKNISGHNPDIIDFIHKQKKVFESWGYHVEIVHSAKDYMDVFHHRLTRSPNPDRVGLVHGFVPSGICAVKRDCKLKPIYDWYKTHPGKIIQYEGIAIDEPSRLIAMHKQANAVSLLEKYHYTEDMAMKLCKLYGMLSPQYYLPGMTRDGCWFCPNAKLCEHRAIMERIPEAWDAYVALEDIPNLAYPHWNVYTQETLHDRDRTLKAEAKCLNYNPVQR